MGRRANADGKPRIAVIGLKGLPAYGGSARAGENMMARLADRYAFTVYNTASHTRRTSGTYDGVEQIVFPALRGKPLNALAYYCRSLWHCLFSGRYDLVHLFHIDAAFVVPFLRLRYPVLAGHRARPQEFSKWGPVARLYFALMEQVFYKLPADVLTSVSRRIAEEDQPRTRREIVYVPNGVVLDGLDSLPAPEVGQVDDYLLFASGRVIESKGAHVLLQALAEIGYPGKVLIVGNLDHQPAYAERLRGLARGLDVDFVGLVEDKRRLLALLKGARLIVYPSRHEGMSNMLLEAGSVRRPLICSDIPENRAIFDEDEVFFFRCDSVADLAERIAFVLENEPLALEVARRGFEKIRREFNWDELADRYAELYDRLLSGEGPLNR